MLKSNATGVCPSPVVASAEFGSLITGGGGFSLSQPAGKYQRSAVQAWLANCPNKPPATWFNASNRAYPDISLFGHNYLIVNNAAVGFVDGTSASSPSVAGLFALVIAARREKNLGNLGFLNYALYEAAAQDPRTFIDITQGSNRCMESRGGCCPTGFTACAGYDPVTGQYQLRVARA